MKSARSFPRAAAAVLGTALVMVAWSEFVFYNGDVAAPLTGSGVASGVRHLGTILLYYAIAGAAAVAAVAAFGADGPARAMLIGALIGYVIEGALVPAVYEAPPVSYLWTAIAWHAPVTVGLGLFLMPWLLDRAGFAAMVGISVLLGAFWGLWMPWTWLGETATPLTGAEFAGFAALTTVCLWIGYALLRLAGWPDLHLARPGRRAVGLAVALLFALSGLSAPFPALGLAAILAALLWGLGRLGHGPARAARPRIRNLAALALMPAIAALVYEAGLASGGLVAPDDLPPLAFVAGMLIWCGCLVLGTQRCRSRRVPE